MKIMQTISCGGPCYCRHDPVFGGPTEDKNKKLVRDVYELAFNQHKPTEAAKKYIGDKYIRHTPNVPNGAEAFYGYFEGFFKEHPQSYIYSRMSSPRAISSSFI